MYQKKGPLFSEQPFFIVAYFFLTQISLQMLASRRMLQSLIYFYTPTLMVYSNQDFAFETTLATKSYKAKIINAKANNYHVTLLYLWLQNPNLAVERVKQRVSEGGHNINTAVIIRRYFGGIKNLFEIYIPVVDELLIFDNSVGKHALIAEKTLNKDINVLNELKFKLLKNNINEV